MKPFARFLNTPKKLKASRPAALLTASDVGEYELCCRTIDANGIAQPLPRPFPKSGRNEIQRIQMTVEA